MPQKKSSQKLNKQIDNALGWLLRTGVLLSLITTVATVVLLGREAAHFFGQVSIVEFFTGKIWEPMIEPKSFGILPLFAGTFLIAFGAIALALPVGLMIAVQMSEFSSPRLRSWLKPALEVLAGIPTVCTAILPLRLSRHSCDKYFQKYKFLMRSVLR